MWVSPGQSGSRIHSWPANSVSCSVIDCGSRPEGWRGYDVYICMNYFVHKTCMDRGTWVGLERWCPLWDEVVGYTGTHWSPTLSATTVFNTKQYWTPGNFSFSRQMGGQSKEGQNPLLLSLNWKRSPISTPNNHMLFLILGVEQGGTATKSILQINVRHPPPITRTDIALTPKPHVLSIVRRLEFSHIGPTDVIALATGYSDRNLWLEWLAAEAQKHMNASCVACASARPPSVHSKFRGQGGIPMPDKVDPRSHAHKLLEIGITVPASL